ncbi:MAG: metal ABC transporter permease [Pseudomonadota bacterium]|mgnify:CR=1 FL=1
MIDQINSIFLNGFLINAIIGGVFIAIIAGLLGTFVLWRNMSYFGDALSHSALLGVALGILLNLNLTLAVICVSILFASLFSFNKSKYSNDTSLGILSYSALSIAIIVASYNKIKIDLFSYLFGDILIISIDDLYYLLSLGLIIIVWVYINWSKLVLLCISPEILKSEAVNVKLLNFSFSLVLALFVAISFKIVGILLITAMLIIPAASALAISKSPLQMVMYSIIIGLLSVAFGIVMAVMHDFPTGPSIISIALGLFLVLNLRRCFYN